MRPRTVNPITCLMGLVTIVALTTPRPADACTAVSLDRGLTVIPSPVEERRIAGDGVLAFDAFIRDEPPELALTRFSLALTPEDGGPAIAGTASHRLLGTHPYTEIEDYQQIVLVWRPAAPLAPGPYTAEATLEREFGPDVWTFPVVVEDAPAPPLAPPQIDAAEALEFDDEALERVCCEVGQSSCGTSSMCEPTRVRVVPGFGVRASLAAADIERAYLWIAPWDGQAAGLPFDRSNHWYSRPWTQPWWSEWESLQPILLPDAAGETCVVVGATSLIDGSTALAEPICRELAAAHEEPRTPDFAPVDDGFGPPCLTPPVYEHDGSPYPPEPASGCRIAPTGSGAFLLLLLAGRRTRRRSRAT